VCSEGILGDLGNSSIHCQLWHSIETSGQHHAPTTLKQNVPPVSLNRRLDVSLDISGEEKNFFTLLVNEPQIIQPTA